MLDPGVFIRSAELFSIRQGYLSDLMHVGRRYVPVSSIPIGTNVSITNKRYG